MASYQSKKSDDRKASSLAEPAVTQVSVRHRREENDRPGRGAGMMPGASARRRRVIAILVDILLLLLLAGLIAGGWFAYRAIREVYAPTWETREVVFRVEMTGIDPDMVKYGQDGRPTMVGKDIWSSDRTDADRLGTVTDVRTVLITAPDGKNTLTLYLTVKAQAYYREGKGYRMGVTMLLAGSEGIFRVTGMSAPGTIISMHEVVDEEPLADEAPDAAVNEALNGRNVYMLLDEEVSYGTDLY